MLERDGKIEESLVKGQQLQVTTTKYKKTASQANRKYKWRYYCTRFWVVFIVLLILTLVIAALAGAFKSSDDKKDDNNNNSNSTNTSYVHVQEQVYHSIEHLFLQNLN